MKQKLIIACFVFSLKNSHNKRLSKLFFFICLDYYKSMLSKLIFQIKRFAFESPKSIKIKDGIRMNQFNTKYNGFILYESKQTKSIRILSAVFVVFIGLSGIKYYFADDQIRRNDMIILAIGCSSFFLYQWRILNTMKRLVLDKRGEKLTIYRFGLCGIRQRGLQTPIEIMRGITKATSFGGIMIKGGGIFGYKEQSFFFQQSGVLNTKIFQQAVKGKQIKIID